MELRGAAAIVTGGASGIGAATVAQLRDAGARVAVLDVHDAPCGYLIPPQKLSNREENGAAPIWEY